MENSINFLIHSRREQRRTKNILILFQVPDIDVNASDSYGLTPLFWSVINHGWGYGNNTMDIAESLLKR